jgi:hypothetical protein
MLSSEHGGEVVAAAQALTKALKSQGLDIHALADHIGSGKKFTEADATEIYRRGVEDGKREAEKAQPIIFQNVAAHDEPSWHEIACECRRLRNDRERVFVRDMARRLVHGGEPTEKQAAWLRSIYARVR